MNQLAFNKAVILLLSEMTTILQKLGYEYSEELADSPNDAAVLSCRLFELSGALNSLNNLDDLQKADANSLFLAAEGESKLFERPGVTVADPQVQ